jgi:tetratricopeptide (TPR) repeat protein
MKVRRGENPRNADVYWLWSISLPFDSTTFPDAVQMARAQHFAVHAGNGYGIIERAESQNAMECPGCKRSISDDSHFCRLCGTHITPKPGSDEPTHRLHPGHQLKRGSSFLGRYRIAEELGRGGMGIVYKAEDTKLRRNVALKFLPPEYTRNAEAKERFIHEAQAASSLEHPNICSIHEIEETDDGQMYISMGCYDGNTLQKIIREGPVDIGEVVDVGIQVAQGLQEAHDKGIVHRDIKPSNIIMTSKGRAKVMDFGLAKLAGQTRITKAGTAMGTVSYMSPEQARGEDVDTRTDIWSLGVVLYEMVTGQLPFKGEYDQAVIYSILNEDPSPVSEIAPGTPQGFSGIVSRCLEKEPASRYQSAAELEADLDRWREESGLGRPSRYGGAYSRQASSGTLLRIGIPLALALLIAFLIPASRNAIKGLFGIGAPPKEIRVALLPCAIGEETEYQRAFCDGLVLTLTNQLEEMRDLPERVSVVPAEDIRDFKTVSPHDARVNHGANAVIGGTFEWGAGGIGLTMARTDVSVEYENGRESEILKQRGSIKLADPIANLATWQDSLVLKVLRLLDVHPEQYQIRALTEGHTTIPAAFSHYIEGQGYLYPYGGGQDIDRAIEAYADAVAEDPVYEKAVYGLGRAYSWKYWFTKDMKWADLAVSCGRRVLDLNAASQPGHLLLGRIYINSAQHDKASEILEAAVLLDSTDTDAYGDLGRAYMDLGEYEKARAVCLRIMDLNPRDYMNLLTLGYTYYLELKFEEAIKYFKLAAEIKPNQAGPYNYLGAAYSELEMWSEATEMFERSRAIDSTSASASWVVSNLGTLYFKQGRFADAERLYRRALEVSSEEYKIWAHLAEAQYWNPEDREEAPKNFRRAAELAEAELQADSLDAVVISDLASYCEKLGQDERARLLLERAAALDPQEVDVIIHIAETYEMLGERDIALDWIARALEMGAPPSRVNRYPGLSQLRVDTRYVKLIEG